MAESLQRLEAQLDRVTVRHSEQIERLETLVRELVLTAEALRKGVSEATPGREPKAG